MADTGLGGELPVNTSGGLLSGTGVLGMRSSGCKPKAAASAPTGCERDARRLGAAALHAGSDVADAVASFAGERARSITGEDLNVSSGWVMH